MPVEGFQAQGFGDIAEKLRRSTVAIGAGRRGHGSGLIVRPEGVIVTNAHVAAGGPLLVQFWDGTRAEATLEERDAARDIAILRVARAGLPAATLADSEGLRIGELVIAVGNPFGFQGALTTGVVHAIGRVPQLGPMKWIQADVRLAPGNSGGPLADARGDVVGINTMIVAGVGLAVPSNTVTRLLSGLLSGQHSQAPLGVVARPVPIEVASRSRLGLVILEIAKESAAAMASLLLGDVLVGAEGKLFDSLEDFERALDGAGERVVNLQFLRGDRAPTNPKIRSVAVRLGTPKTPHAEPQPAAA